MDAKTIEAAVAQAKADVAERQAEGMVIDAWGVVEAILNALFPSSDSVPVPPSAPAQPSSVE